MVLPKIASPENYRGLYVFDFGEWSAVGYTADEIAVLLEDPRYRDGRVYRIHSAHPDGRMELRGIAPERFQFEAGMFFYRAALAAAREDFDALARLGEASPPPCRAFVQLAENKSPGQAGQYVTALIYPSESDDDVARWLLDADYAGGDTVEGGISHVTTYYALDKYIVDRRQLVAADVRASRAADDVLASVRVAVQR